MKYKPSNLIQKALSYSYKSVFLPQILNVITSHQEAYGLNLLNKSIYSINNPKKKQLFQ
jgi:hypothetical protein